MTTPDPLRLRAYRVLLRVLPRRFRDERGLQMEHLFLDITDERARRGRRLGIVFWLGVMWDTGIQAVRERLSPSRPDPRPPAPHPLGVVVSPLVRDVHLAFRSFRKNPLFSATVVITLMMGIGATVTIFSAINGVLLRPLDYDRPDELVILKTVSGEDSFEAMSQPDILDVRAETETLTDLTIWRAMSATFNSRTGEPSRVDGARVTANFFDVLGARPTLGRFFLPTEGVSTTAPLLVLSHGAWQGLFGANPGVVGSTLEASGTQYTVIGVAPPEFMDPVTPGVDFIGEARFWVLFPWESNGNRSWRGFWTIGRMRPDVDLLAVRADVARIGQNLQQEYPNTNTGKGVGAEGLQERLVGTTRPAMLVLLAAVGMVLLIACANVANLLLSRAAGREREIAVRTALGASRGRLIAQLLTESAMLALVGGALGLSLAYFGGKLVSSLAGAGIPRASEIAIDGPVLLFALGVSLAASLLFGLAPAVRSSLVPIGLSLKEGARGASGGVHGRVLRSSLVVVEVALSVVLLIGAGLLIRSFANLHGVELGVDRDHVLTFETIPPVSDYPDDASLNSAYRAFRHELMTIPGVAAAGAVSDLPLTGAVNETTLRRADLPPAEPGKGVLALTRAATPGFFEAMGTPMAQGRAFTEDDDGNAPLVAIINEAAAKRFFPNTDPLGHQVITTGAAWEVVGVSSDVQQSGPGEGVQVTVYLPYDQLQSSWVHSRSLSMVVRTAGDPVNIARQAQAAVWNVNARTPIRDIKTTGTLLDDRVAAPRFRTLLLTAFAGLAIILAMVGIGGVLAFWVSQRRREIGVRRALGAQTADVLGLVVRQSVRLTALGVAIGVAGALATSRVMSSFLFEVAPVDPVVFAAVPVLLSGVALMASYFPARAASRVDPIWTLREE